MAGAAEEEEKKRRREAQLHMAEEKQKKENGSCLGKTRSSSGVRGNELGMPLTDELTRSSPGFKPCHLKTKTPTHFSCALP